MTNTGAGASVAVAASRAAEQKVIRALRDCAATEPDFAVELPRRGLSDAALRRLMRAGVVVQADEGRLWLDEQELEQWRAGRRSRVLLILLAVLTLAAITLAIGWAAGWAGPVAP